MLVTVNALPVIKVNPLSPSVCSGGTVSITAFGGLNYTWTPNNFLNTNVGATVLANPTSTTNYTVIGEDINGCTNLKTFTVRLDTLPVVSFVTNINSGCSPLSVLINNLTQQGSVTGYKWDFGDGSPNSTLANPGSHTFFAGQKDTVYYIHLIGYNSCGTDTFTYAISVKTNTVTAFFSTSPISGCAPQNISFTNYSSAGTFISWDFGDGNVSTQQNPTHLYVTPGTYTCNEYVNNGCGFDTASIVLQIYPSAGLSFIPSSQKSCVNQSIAFNNTSANTVNTIWNFGDATTSNLFSPVHSYTTPGSYTVTLTGTSSIYGCISTYSTVIDVVQTPSTQVSPNINSGCTPLIVSFSNISINASSYYWNFGDGNTSTLYTPTHTYNSGGIFTVSLVVYGSTICSDTTYMTINAFQKPTAAFIDSANYKCTTPVTVYFTNTSTGAIGYLWDFGNGTNSINNNPSVTYNSPGAYSISLISSSGYGCSDTSTQVYVASIKPKANFDFIDPEKCKPIINFTNTSQNAQNYLWIFGDGYTSTSQDPTHTYETYDSSNVILIAYNDSTCTDTVSKKVVHVNGNFTNIFIPSAFTPNNDGLNDKFEIVGFYGCEEFVLRIFNRWGEEVFKTQDMNNFWDGTYQGEKVKSDTYVYTIEGVTFERRGTVTVIYNFRN